MKDDYGLIESGIPPELVAKLLGTRSRQQIADAMLAASQKGIQSDGPPGSKVSWTQGLAQLMQAYQGRKGIEEADASRQAIADEISKGRQAALEKYQSLVVPASPGVQPLTPNDDEGNAMPSAPATSRDPRKAVEFAMTSPYLEKSKLPLMDLADFNRDEDRRENREFQKEQKAEARAAEERMLQIRLSDQRISAQERRALEERLAKMQIEARADLARFAAANRPAPPAEPLVAVQGPDGKPVLLPRSQAAGKTPAARAGQGMSATAQKELIETDEQIQGGDSAIKAIEQAQSINDKAMGFVGAGTIAKVGSLLPDGMRPQTFDDTLDLDNLITSTAVPQLKAIFGGNPTEGERKVLLELQGSSGQPAPVRKKIFERAKKAVEARMEFAKKKASSLRKGTYFGDEGASNAASVLDEAAAYLKGQ